jgi:glycosyltransferase involved in cell wall biosynthesis
VTPAEEGNGLAMRAGLFLESLARSYSVRVLVVPIFSDAAAPDGFVRRHASDFAVLELDPPREPRTELTDLLSTQAGRRRAEALHPRPSLCRPATPAAAEAVAARAEGCAGVFVTRAYLAPFCDAVLDRAQRPRLILDLDDFDSDVQRALGQSEEAERYERLESHYLPLFDCVITCSALDRAEVARRHAVPRPEIVPNAVRPPALVEGPEGPHDLIFVANLSYAPNIDAALWLCDEVMPLLEEVTVALVGSRPAPQVRSLADAPELTLAADVPAVSPWYAGATVAVAPLRVGGGTRIKVLEAYSHRRPVVSTTQGARGLPLVGEDGSILIADTATDFAAACKRLLDEPRLAERLASRGASIVEKRATVDSVAGSIVHLFADILAAR